MSAMSSSPDDPVIQILLMGRNTSGKRSSGYWEKKCEVHIEKHEEILVVVHLWLTDIMKAWREDWLTEDLSLFQFFLHTIKTKYSDGDQVMPH